MEVVEPTGKFHFPTYTWIFLICLGVMNIAWTASQFLLHKGYFTLGAIMQLIHLGLDIEVIYWIYILYPILIGFYRIFIAIKHRKMAPIMISISWVSNLLIILGLFYLKTPISLIDGSVNALIMFILDSIPLLILVYNMQIIEEISAKLGNSYQWLNNSAPKNLRDPVSRNTFISINKSALMQNFVASRSVSQDVGIFHTERILPHEVKMSPQFGCFSSHLRFN